MVMKQNYKEKIRTIFNSDFCGMQDFVSYVLEPIFGDGILYPAPQTIDYKKDIVKNVVCVGEIMGLYSNPILIYEVTLSDSCNIGRSRVYIQDAVRSDMLAYTNAFIVFHYENMTNRSWRFSFAQKEDTKSAMKTAKRYTYLAGKDYSCRTIADRFATLYENKDTLIQESFLQAFSVEALSKEFFDEYTSFYNDFVNFVTNDDVMFPRFLNVAKKDTLLAEKYVRDYIKKLMGRLVFIQFLQKKGWLCNDLNYLQTLFASSTKAEKANFLDNVLEPMFFGVFNTDVKDRKDLFEKKKWNLNLLKKWNSFPYLNGGLFESDELDDLKLPIPGYFFSNPEKKDVVRKPDDNYYEDSCGLLDFFERYNFTIDENDPDDAEVGVDPEMLGKIFENLLEDNKDKGAFYTPKEIVQYMCQESIVQYLKTHTKESLHPAIEELIKEKNVNKLIQNKAIAKTVYTLLHDVKVCDPAIGSGAFPMGILNELYRAQVLLYGFTDPINDFSPSNIKREIIQNNIYGVDIEKGAIDIARLRFWLSIVVDSEEPEPLPNFDYKFMQGNSLLEQFEGVDLSRIYDKPKYAEQISMAFDDETDAKDELWHNMIEYFSVTDHKHKQQLRNNIGDSVRKLLLAKASKAEIREKISSIDPTANQNFFLWHTWFADVFENGGFDIVIGNPPYIKEGRMSKVFFEPYKGSPYYKGKMDIWYLFACNGLDLLKQNGSLCFIATNNWVTSFGASKLRNKVIKETRICNIVDFGAVMMFESASIQTMIMMFQKDAVTDDYTLDYRKLMAYNATEKEAAAILNKTAVNAEYFFPTIRRANFVDKNITFSKSADVIGEIVSANNVIYLNDNEIAQGIVFPQDTLNRKNQQKLGENYYVGQGVFVLTNDEKKSLLLSQNELTLIKPYYTSENIVRYVSFPFNNYWAIYTDSKYKNPNSLNSFPNIKRHLDKFLPIFTSDNKPYGLHRAREERFFCNEKVIVLRKCAGRPVFAYCDFNCYLSQSFNMIQTERIDMKYLTGLLNSKLMEFWLKNKGKMQGANYQLDKEPLMQIPIAVPSEDIQLLIAKIVDIIIILKRSGELASNLVTNDYLASEFEQLIDGCIYEIYLPQEMSMVGFSAISVLREYLSEFQTSDMDISDVWPLYSTIDNTGIIERIKTLSLSKSEQLRTIALS